MYQKVCPCARPRAFAKKRPFGQTLGQTLQNDLALYLDDGSPCLPPGAARRHGFPLQCISHRDLLVSNVPPQFQGSSFSVHQHKFAYKAFCYPLWTCMLSSLFVHAWICTCVNLSQPSGEVWETPPQVDTPPSRPLHTDMCDTLGHVMLKHACSGCKCGVRLCSGMADPR